MHISLVLWQSPYVSPLCRLGSLISQWPWLVYIEAIFGSEYRIDYSKARSVFKPKQYERNLTWWHNNYVRSACHLCWLASTTSLCICLLSSALYLSPPWQWKNFMQFNPLSLPCSQQVRLPSELSLCSSFRSHSAFWMWHLQSLYWARTCSDKRPPQLHLDWSQDWRLWCALCSLRGFY